MDSKGTVEPWDCTFESGCDCPECQLVNEQAEQEEFDRIVEMNTPGCCRGGRRSG